MWLNIIIIWIISSVWPIDGTQAGTNTPGQSGPGSNVNEGVTQMQ